MLAPEPRPDRRADPRAPRSPPTGGEPVGQAGPAPRFRVHGRVGHRGRVRDEALDAAEGLGQREVRKVGQKARTASWPPASSKVTMAPKACLLAPGDLMTGVLRQAGVVNPLDAGLLHQPMGQRLGVASVLLEARVQSAQAAQRHEAVERRAGQAQAVRPPARAARELCSARDHRPAHHIAVAVEVLGGRMHDEVGAEVDGLLPHGRQEGIVDHHQCAGARGRGPPRARYR